MKNKFGYIALFVNILLIFVNLSPLFSGFLGLWRFAFIGIDDGLFLILSILMVIMVSYIILSIKRSFRNTENLFLRVLNLFLLSISIASTFFYFYYTFFIMFSSARF